MRAAAQIVAVTAVGLRSIPHRLGNSLVIVIGIASVVAVLISVLAMSAGFQRIALGDARPDRAIVLTRGADGEGTSVLSRENVAAIAAASGISKDADGKPIVSAEVLLVAPVARKSTGADAYITLRGVGHQHFRLRPELKLVSGRMFERGLHELIVGQAAQAQFAGLETGSRVRLHDGDWTIVGVFAGGDTVRESEVMSDAQTVLSAYQLDTFNSVWALLADEGSLATLRDALSVQPALSVNVLTEPQYLAMVSRSINRLLQVVAYAIGGIMAIGALFGALNTMYSAVASRASEIATLRALGFGPRTVLVAILIEALLLAALGAFIGIAVAYLVFDGKAISTLGGSRWDSQVVYSLTITPALVAIATTLACGIGLLGGLLPALRATRASVAESLRTA
ncbi:MAG: ABC transporter permease [Steroidobacteraceae bacterium]